MVEKQSQLSQYKMALFEYPFNLPLSAIEKAAVYLADVLKVMMPVATKLSFTPPQGQTNPTSRLFLGVTTFIPH